MELTVTKVATINVEAHKPGSSDCSWIDMHVYDAKGDELITLSLWSEAFKQIAVTFGEQP